MTAAAQENKRRLLLASDRSDQSSELANILQSVGEVESITTSDIPENPARQVSGIVVDINLRSAESVQRVRNKLRGEAYRSMPRLFVLADALHHASMQAWALGATDTISRPLDAAAILQRVRSAFPDTTGYDATDRGKAFIPVAILDKPGALNEHELGEIREHPRRGYDALAAQGGFPAEMLDVVLHHHEFLDGSGYPNGLAGNQISDIVRLTTIVDIYAALVEKRAYRLPYTHARAFALMEGMGGKLDQQLLQAFRPVAFGAC